MSETIEADLSKSSEASHSPRESKSDIRSWRARLQFYNELRELLNDEKLKHCLWWKFGSLYIHEQFFVRDVMKKCYAATKLCSFQRRLNRW